MPAPVPAAAGPSPAPAHGSPGTPARPTAYAPVPLGAPRPVIDSIFGDLWPERGLLPQVRLLLACLGVGVLSAVVAALPRVRRRPLRRARPRRCRPLAHHEPPGAVDGPQQRPVRRARLTLRGAGGRVADGHRRHARGRGADDGAHRREGTARAPGRTRVLAPRGRARAAPARAHPHRHEPDQRPLARRAHRSRLARRPRRLRGALRLGRRGLRVVGAGTGAPPRVGQPDPPRLRRVRHGRCPARRGLRRPQPAARRARGPPAGASGRAALGVGRPGRARRGPLPRLRRGPGGRPLRRPRVHPADDRPDVCRRTCTRASAS